MNTGALLANTKDYVTRLFTTHPKPELAYHNLQHTRDVVGHCIEIAQHYALTEEARFIIIMAAWYHDTGHLWGDPATHEERGTEIMKTHLSTQKVPVHLLDAISSCIMATKMPTHPQTLPEMIICDADTYHLGTSGFCQADQLVWEEVELRMHKKIAHKAALTLQFLESHTYYTDYCKELLNEGKAKNMQRLQQMAED